MAQLWVASVLKEGDLAIDATVGNGHDTAFLARCVGPSGRVVGFDIQANALDAAAGNLAGEERLLERVNFVQRTHASMKAVLAESQEQRPPRAIMFNLGYLPGADKTVTTTAEETCRGVAAAADLLAPKGVLTIVLYPGHPEGKKEAAAVMAWAEGLGGAFAVIFSRPLNRAATAPCLVVIEKSG